MFCTKTVDAAASFQVFVQLGFLSIMSEQLQVLTGILEYDVGVLSDLGRVSAISV